MTPRSLFNVILKIIGLLLIKDILETVPQLFMFITWFKIPDTRTDAIWTLISTILVLGFEAAIFYCLVFKTDWVIDKLKLDQGFDQEMILANMHRSTILSISIIVIGGLLIVHEVPNFFRQLFSYFQERRMNYSKSDQEIPYLVLAGAKVFIGVLLIAYQRTLVNLIERQRKK